jgi:hypothetical protein
MEGSLSYPAIGTNYETGEVSSPRNTIFIWDPFTCYFLLYG